MMHFGLFLFLSSILVILYGNPTGATPVSAHGCAGTCLGVNSDAPEVVTGACTCYAARDMFGFWHRGYYGPTVHLGLRRRDFELEYRQTSKSTLAQEIQQTGKPVPAPPPDLQAQLDSGKLPSPCNASYVSFACVNSKDGIVHEPISNWLGALLPANAKTIPPVPEKFLQTHGSSVVKPAPPKPSVSKAPEGDTS